MEYISLYYSWLYKFLQPIFENGKLGCKWAAKIIFLELN